MQTINYLAIFFPQNYSEDQERDDNGRFAGGGGSESGGGKSDGGLMSHDEIAAARQVGLKEAKTAEKTARDTLNQAIKDHSKELTQAQKDAKNPNVTTSKMEGHLANLSASQNRIEQAASDHHQAVQNLNNAHDAVNAPNPGAKK